MKQACQRFFLRDILFKCGKTFPIANFLTFSIIRGMKTNYCGEIYVRNASKQTNSLHLSRRLPPCELKLFKNAGITVFYSAFYLL